VGSNPTPAVNGSYACRRNTGARAEVSAMNSEETIAVAIGIAVALLFLVVFLVFGTFFAAGGLDLIG
jgi:hypothetical protein